MNNKQKSIKHLNEEIDRLNAIIVDLRLQLSKAKDTSGRKDQVLKLLRDNEAISILDIAESLNISTKNVSSQLTYLRSDGHKIYTDHNGRKVLIES